MQKTVSDSNTVTAAPGGGAGSVDGRGSQSLGRGSQEYLQKCELIKKVATCEYHQQDLVDELDAEADYESKMRAWGLQPLRTKRLDANPTHKAMLHRLIRFYDAHEQYRQRLNQIPELEITKAQQEKMAELNRKKRIFEALKGLMQKLIYTADEALLQEQLERVKTWLEDKVMAVQDSSSNKENAQKAALAKRRAEAQGMSKSQVTKLPEIRCRCGQSHDSIGSDGPQGTLNLATLLEQADSRKHAKRRLYVFNQASSSTLLPGPRPRFGDYHGTKNQSQSAMSTADRTKHFGSSSDYGSNQIFSNAGISTQVDSRTKGALSSQHHYQTIAINEKPMGTSGYREHLDALDATVHSEHMREVYRSAVRMRDKSLDMDRHHTSLHKTTLKWGRGKTSMESDLMQCRDRAVEASNFQDLGIKARVRIQPPEYQNSKEFIEERETSDEELSRRNLASRGDGQNLRKVDELNEESWEPIERTKVESHRSRVSSHGPTYKNFESAELICRVKTELKLPADEQPDIMVNYMRKRMALQAQTSLQSKNVESAIDRELRRRRIAQLRLHHQKLLGVKVLDKNATFYGLPVNGPSIYDLDKPKKKAAEEEVVAAEQSDEEIFNATTNKPNAISLSIYDDKNILKKKFQKQYYASPGQKSDPAQSRNQLISKFTQIENGKRHRASTSAIEPAASTVTQVRSRFGLHLAGKAGNVSGLDIVEEHADHFKVPKNTELFNSRQLAKVNEQLDEALEQQAAAERAAAPKKKAPAKDKKGKKKDGQEEAPNAADAEPSYFGQLKELIRSERFEARQGHIAELEDIKAHLTSKQLAVPADVLRKGMFLPEDEVATKDVLARGYPRAEDMLLKNPFPAVKKGKKGKKKK